MLNGVDDMAKKIKAKTETAISTGVVQTMDETAQFAVDIKTAYYEAFKRQPMVSIERIVKIIQDDTSTETMAVEYWLDLVKKAEDKLNIATPRVEQTNAIIDILSKDNELTEVTTVAAAAGDLPPRAPSMVAFLLERDHADQFNGDHVKARQFIVDSYADPGSKMKDFKDGWGNEVGENMRPGYLWDWADYGSGTISWFANTLVDNLPSGKAINKSLLALQERKDAIVEFDGINLNPATMAPAQRNKAMEQLRNRRTRLISIHRDAVDVIRQWVEIKARLGDVVTVTWAWLDDANPSMGLVPTKAIIVVRNIIQDGENKGQVGTAFYPYTAAQFINLSVDHAKSIAAKAGRDRVSILDLVNSKREKKTAVSAGSKLAKAKRAAEEAAKVSAGRIPDWFHKLREWTEVEGNKSALLTSMNHMKQHDLRLFLYDVVQVVSWVDKNLVTPDAQKIAAAVEAELTADRQKEIDAKAQAAS